MKQYRELYLVPAEELDSVRGDSADTRGRFIGNVKNVDVAQLNLNRAETINVKQDARRQSRTHQAGKTLDEGKVYSLEDFGKEAGQPLPKKRERRTSGSDSPTKRPDTVPGYLPTFNSQGPRPYDPKKPPKKPEDSFNTINAPFLPPPPPQPKSGAQRKITSAQLSQVLKELQGQSSKKSTQDVTIPVSHRTRSNLARAKEDPKALFSGTSAPLPSSILETVPIPKDPSWETNLPLIAPPPIPPPAPPPSVPPSIPTIPKTASVVPIRKDELWETAPPPIPPTPTPRVLKPQTEFTREELYFPLTKPPAKDMDWETSEAPDQFWMDEDYPEEEGAGGYWNLLGDFEKEQREKELLGLTTTRTPTGTNFSPEKKPPPPPPPSPPPPPPTVPARDYSSKYAFDYGGENISPLPTPTKPSSGADDGPPPPPPAVPARDYSSKYVFDYGGENISPLPTPTKPSSGADDGPPSPPAVAAALKKILPTPGDWGYENIDDDDDDDPDEIRPQPFKPENPDLSPYMRDAGKLILKPGLETPPINLPEPSRVELEPPPLKMKMSRKKRNSLPFEVQRARIRNLMRAIRSSLRRIETSGVVSGENPSQENVDMLSLFYKTSDHDLERLLYKDDDLFDSAKRLQSYLHLREMKSSQEKPIIETYRPDEMPGPDPVPPAASGQEFTEERPLIEQRKRASIPVTTVLRPEEDIFDLRSRKRVSDVPVEDLRKGAKVTFVKEAPAIRRISRKSVNPSKPTSTIAYKTALPAKLRRQLARRKKIHPESIKIPIAGAKRLPTVTESVPAIIQDILQLRDPVVLRKQKKKKKKNPYAPLEKMAKTE